MRNTIVLGAVGFVFLALIAISSWQQVVPAPLPPVQSTPVPDRYLPPDLLVPAVVYDQTAQFEQVDNFAGVKRGERLMPAADEPVGGDEALASVAPAVIAVSPVPGAGGPIDLLDGLTAPSLTSDIALAGPDMAASAPVPTQSATAPGRPQTASAAIAASVRGLVRRIEEGASGALLSFN